MMPNLKNISTIKTWHCGFLLLPGLFLSALLNAQQPQLLKDINPGPGFSLPYGYTELNSQIYFSADDGVHGWAELWVTDGTEAGTYMLKDINPGGDGWIDNLTIYNGKLYFRADDGVHGEELWVSDGTANGTYLLKDIDTTGGPDYYGPKYLTVFDNKLYFSGYDGIHGYELWVTDGTTAGTYMLKDINLGSAASDPRYFTEYNGKLYFWANDGTYGRELWVTDGTEVGTYMVKDINPGAAWSGPMGFTQFNNKLYFQAGTADHGGELWVTDGTETGTYMVKDINPGQQSSNPYFFIEYNNNLYFSADDGIHGRELWVTDGTEAGTQMVKDINLGSEGSSPAHLTIFNNKLYFGAVAMINNQGFQGLWVSDGTVQGTKPIVNSPYPSEFTLYDGKLYFVSRNKVLWVTDGTEQGSYSILPEDSDFPIIIHDPFQNVYGLKTFNDILYFTACYFWEYGCEPYFIDHSLSVNTFENGTVSYWPNPFTDKLHLEATVPIEKVNIYNVKGQKLVSAAPGTTRESLILPHSPAGIYFMEVQTKNGRETIKLVRKP